MIIKAQIKYDCWYEVPDVPNEAGLVGVLESIRKDSIEQGSRQRQEFVGLVPDRYVIVIKGNYREDSMWIYEWDRKEMAFTWRRKGA